MTDSHSERAAWQPIDTAPRDGTDILVCNIGDRPILVSWNTQLGGPGWLHAERYYWNYVLPENSFTYWMPLPAGPKP